MSVRAASASALETARAFAYGYAHGRAPEVVSLLADDVHEREIVPAGFLDQRGPEAVVTEAVDFLEPFGAPEVLRNELEPLGPLVRWTVRWRLRSGDESWLIEWHAFLTVEDGRITKMDAVCSGRVPDA